MSKFTKFLDRPASVATDVVVSVGVGAASVVVLKGLIPIIPFMGGLTDLIAWPGAGVIGAMTYHRARKNLTDPTPPSFKP